MVFGIFKKSNTSLCKISFSFLAFFLLLGISVGVTFVSYFFRSVDSLMCISFPGTVSIVGLLVGSVVPIMILFLIVSLEYYILLIPYSFAEGFLWGYCNYFILCLFESCGWLVRFFLLFSANISLFLIVWILHFWLTTSDSKRFRVFGPSLAVSGFVVLLDYYLILPYWMSLID